MLDWWEATLLSVATAGTGGLIGLSIAYFTQRWTTKARRESEEREAKLRVEEEQRQVIRQFRRERIKPVLEFLELWHGYMMRWVLNETPDEFDKLDPQERDERIARWKRLDDEVEGLRKAAAAVKELVGLIETKA